MANTILKQENLSFFRTEKEFILNRLSLNLLDSSQIYTKRAFDLISSMAFLFFIGSWMFPLIALLIKLDSKGPVFFKQLRHGQNNEPFYCIKFRTMVINGDSDTKQATKNDPRITKLGRFLRKTSLDEFPQIFNVIRGEMSVVGPRPHAIPMNREFAKKVEHFMCRHLVKPGITGLAQSKGFRGEIVNHFDLNSRIKYDLFYIENWSLVFDFKIIFWTIKSLLFNNGKAY
ncbi:sugar transferase [Pararhodonellum marinum]|uniref:sugar transferase n=1 Tax=Pararhodonellum marinum TaxID=2755358 RepID=UPI0018909C1A|nr:sugar transferase [Pararhodonellum marinum]